MSLDIVVGILSVIAVAACIWSWWVDNGGSFKQGEKKNMEKYAKDKNE